MEFCARNEIDLGMDFGSKSPDFMHTDSRRRMFDSFPAVNSVNVRFRWMFSLAEFEMERTSPFWANQDQVCWLEINTLVTVIWE